MYNNSVHIILVNLKKVKKVKVQKKTVRANFSVETVLGREHSGKVSKTFISI